MMKHCRCGFRNRICTRGQEIVCESVSDTQVLENVCGDVATSPVLTGSVESLQKV